MLTSIVGINWGDGARPHGRSAQPEVQRRRALSGRQQRRHTVINDRGKFVLNLLPSGILRDETVNVMGPGMVIDTEHLFHEIERLRDGGITVTPEHLKSDKAVICMPYTSCSTALRKTVWRTKVRLHPPWHLPCLLGQVHEKGAAHGRTGRP